MACSCLPVSGEKHRTAEPLQKATHSLSSISMVMPSGDPSNREVSTIVRRLEISPVASR